MDIHEYIELIMLLFWIISIISIGILSHIRFKEKHLEQFRITADNLMKKYIDFYSKENLTDDQKISRIVFAITDSLKKQNFEVNDQDIKNIFTKVSKSINNSANQNNK